MGHDKNYIPKLKRKLQYLSEHEVHVGIFGDDDSFVLMIARVHEFGVSIEVTPKMRAWFAYQGFPLRADTTEIRIPERSYMRGGYDSNEDDIFRHLETYLGQVIDFDLAEEAALERVGIKVQTVLQKYLTELSSPPLSGMTVKRKGSSNPLIDTGRLRQSITYKVVAR